MHKKRDFIFLWRNAESLPLPPSKKGKRSIDNGINLQNDVNLFFLHLIKINSYLEQFVCLIYSFQCISTGFL